MLTKISQKFGQNLSPDFHKIVTNTFWLMSDNLLRMGGGLIVGVWVARYLGPANFGLLMYAAAYVAMFEVIAKAGLYEITTRDLVQKPAARDEILGTALAIKLTSAGIAFALAVGIFFLLNKENLSTFWLVSIIALGLFFQSLDVIDFWFQSQVQSKYTVYAKNIVYVIVNGIKIFLIIHKAPLIAFAIILFTEVALGSMSLIVVYQLVGHSFKGWTVRFSTAKRFLKECWPNLLTGASVAIYMRADQLMLNSMVGDEAVGIYSVGVRFAELWYFIPGAIVASITPGILLVRQGSQELYHDRIQKALNLFVLIFYTISIGIVCFSKPLITLLYGSNYTSSSLILAIYVWSGVFVSMGLVRNMWITGEGLFRFGFVTTLTGAVLNVILNLLLIPRYAGAGAALATVISYGFSDYLILLFYPPSRKIGWMMTKALALDFVFSKFKKTIKVS